MTATAPLKIRPVIAEAEVVSGALRFASDGDLPRFMVRLPGVPFEVETWGTVANVATGEMRRVPLEVIRMTNAAEHPELKALHTQFVEALEGIAAGRLSRAERKRIAAEARRVTVKLSGDQRVMRPADLEIPDLRAALGYVLHILVTRKYSRRLARCKLKGCPKYFLREPRRARPECYCSPAHAKQGKVEAGKKRAMDYRAREAAIAELKSQFPARARQLVKDVARTGLTKDELVILARTHAASAAAKHK